MSAQRAYITHYNRTIKVATTVITYLLKNYCYYRLLTYEFYIAVYLLELIFPRLVVRPCLAVHSTMRAPMLERACAARSCQHREIWSEKEREDKRISNRRDIKR